VNFAENDVSLPVLTLVDLDSIRYWSWMLLPFCRWPNYKRKQVLSVYLVLTSSCWEKEYKTLFTLVVLVNEYLPAVHDQYTSDYENVGVPVYL